MEKMYFAKAWLLSQIIFNTDDTARVTSELVNEGALSLDYALELPYILVALYSYGRIATTW